MDTERNESEVKTMGNYDKYGNYIPDESEIEPTRPYTAEERAELNELYARMAADLAEING